jgi:hypothetical protein
MCAMICNCGECFQKTRSIWSFTEVKFLNSTLRMGWVVVRVWDFVS